MQRVLIIMKSDCLRDALQRELQQSFEVIICDEANDDVLLVDRPDALVLDLLLPVADGLTFLIQNKTFLPPVIIALTVLLTPDIVQELSNLGVAYVIRKPCTVGAVTSALKACV